MPMLEKRQRGRARFRCLRRGPDSVPSGCGCWAGEGELGGHSLTQGWVLSVLLKGATGQTAALPHALSVWPHEFCSVGQLVPKGQSERPRSSTSKPRRVKVGERKRNCAQM